MNKNNLEIERKFLLKNMPNFNEDVEIMLIHQIYVNLENKIVRFRHTKIFNKENKKVGENYVKCIKTPLSKGVFEELEEDIYEKVFLEMCNKEHGYIKKTRSIYNYEGFKWEIDKYSDLELIIAEVELSDIKQNINIPRILKEQIIDEVTGNYRFSNQSLSIKKKL